MAPFYRVVGIGTSKSPDEYQIYSPDMRIGSAVSKALADEVAAKLNAHDELVAIVQHAIDFLEHDSCDETQALVGDLRAALAKAQS